MIGSSTRKDEALERLTDGIAQLTSSDMWCSWLAMQARFHKYSFSNTVLILAQHPTATRVAGFRTWRQLGRQVQRGQQAIWILAPVTRRLNDQCEDIDRVPLARTVVAFRAVPVFAEDQTSGEPLPEVCHRLSGEDPRGLYEALVQVAHEVGFSVADHAFDGETNGDCSPVLRQIRVEARAAGRRRGPSIRIWLGEFYRSSWVNIDADGQLLARPFDQSLTRQGDDVGRDRGEVVHGDDAFDLSEKALDQAKVVAGNARNRVDHGGLHVLVVRQVEAELHRLMLDDTLKLLAAQRLELMDEADP
jgi:hypothetical protein